MGLSTVPGPEALSCYIERSTLSSESEKPELRLRCIVHAPRYSRDCEQLHAPVPRVQRSPVTKSDPSRALAFVAFCGPWSTCSGPELFGRRRHCSVRSSIVTDQGPGSGSVIDCE